MTDWKKEYMELNGFVTAFAQTVKKGLEDLGGNPEKDSAILKVCIEVFLRHSRQQMEKIIEEKNGETLGNESADGSD